MSLGNSVISEFSIAQIGYLIAPITRGTIVANVGASVAVQLGATARIAVMGSGTVSVAVLNHAKERVGVEARNTETTQITLGVNDE